jgi:hypothetical protein
MTIQTDTPGPWEETADQEKDNASDASAAFEDGAMQPAPVDTLEVLERTLLDTPAIGTSDESSCIFSQDADGALSPPELDLSLTGTRCQFFQPTTDPSELSACFSAAMEIEIDQELDEPKQSGVFAMSWARGDASKPATSFSAQMKFGEDPVFGELSAANSICISAVAPCEDIDLSEAPMPDDWM